MIVNKLNDNVCHAHSKFTNVSGFEILRNDSVYIGRAVYLPGMKEVPGEHDYYVIYYIISGELEVNCEGHEPVVLHEGDTLMFEPGDKRYAENKSLHAVEMLCINVFNK